MATRTLFSRLLLMAFLAAGFCSPALFAPPTNIQWATLNGGNWSQITNWSTNTTPDVSSLLEFSNSLTGSPVVDGTYTVNSMTFHSNISSFTLLGGHGAVLTISSGISQLSDDASGITIDVPLLLGSPFVFEGDGAGSILTITGSVGTTTANSGFTVTDGLDLRILGAFNVTGTLNVTDGALLEFSHQSALSNNIALSNGGALVFGDGTGTLTYSGIISGTGDVTYNDTVTLTSANTYTGASSVTTGANVHVGTTNALPTTTSLNVDSGGTLFVDQNQTVDNLSGYGDVQVASGKTFTNSGENDSTYGGSISGAGSLVKDGTSTLILDGNLTFTGSATVKNGGLVLAISGTVPQNVALEPGSTLQVGTGDNNLSYTGVISGTGDVTFAGNVTLTSASTYTGSTSKVNNGWLDLQVTNALPTTTPLYIDSGNTILVNADQTVESIDGYGEIQIASGHMFTVDGTTNTYFSGDLTGAGSFTKTGGSILALAKAECYEGSTTVNGGVLIVSVTNAIPVTTALAIGTNGTVQLDADQTVDTLSGSGALTIGDGTTFTQTGGSSTFSGAIDGNGALHYTGSGKLTLSGENTFAGGLTIARASTVQIGEAGHAGSVTSDIANDGALIFNRSDSLTYEGAISGAGSLEQAGQGALILTGTNTYTGGTTVDSQATLQIGDGGTTGSIAGNITNGNSVIFDRYDDITYGNIISGTGSLTKEGDGTLTLSGANTFTGGTIVNDGTLRLTNGSALLSTSSVVLNNSGVLNVAANQTLAAVTGGSGTGLTLESNYVLTLNPTSASQFSGLITGGGSLIKSGSQDLTLNNSNTYTGGTSITGGKLIAANFDSLGSATGSGKVTVTSGTLQVGNGGVVGSVTGNIIDNAAVVFKRSDTLTYSGVISGTGTMTQSGTGTLIFTGANTYTGGTVISSGKLQIGNGGSTGSLVGNVQNSGTLVFDRGDSYTFSGQVTGGGALTQSGTGTLILTADQGYTGLTTVAAGALQLGTGGTTGGIDGDVQINSGATLSSNRSDNTSYSGAISGSGMFVKNGGGTLSLLSSIPSFNGSVIINAGSLLIGADNTLSTVNVTVNANGTLDVASQLSIGALGGTGAVTLESGKTLSLNSVQTLNAVLSGAGSLTLNNFTTITADQSFTGATTIGGNMLNLGSSAANSGAGDTAGSVAGNIVTGSGGGVAFNRSNALTYSGVISGAGSVTKNGTGNLTLSGSNTYTGATTVMKGTLTVGSTNALPVSGVSVFSGATFAVANDQTIASLSGQGTTSVSAGKTLTLNNGQPLSSVISGAGNLAINNVVTLTADQTFTGTTTINGGTLNFGSSSANGGAGDTAGSVQGNIVIGSGGNGVFINRSNALTYGGSISGTGFLTKNGTGTLTLAGQNTYTGDTIINAGLLVIGTTNALPTSTALGFSAGGTLDVSASQTIKKFLGTSGALITVESGDVFNVTLDDSTVGTSFAGVISGDGGFRVGTNNGYGHAVTLVATNTYTGGTVIDSGGALRLGAGSNDGMIAGNVTDNGILIFHRANTATFGGTISGTGSVAQGVLNGTGIGTLVLTGANTYTGGTTVYGGKLIVSNSSGSATGTGTVGVNAGALLGGSGTIGGALNLFSGSILSPGSGIGTLHVGDTTFSGGAVFAFQINDAAGTAGSSTGWDLLSISGALNVAATNVNPYVIQVASVDSAGANAAAIANFDQSQNYSWQIATTTTGINNFNATYFSVDTSGFLNSFNGSFDVGVSGNNLVLNYSPQAIPEPSTWAMLALGGLALAFSQRRRFRRR